MILSQLQDKRNKLIADATAVMASENVTAEQRSQFDTMLAEVKTIDTDIARLSAVEEYRSSIKNAPARPNPSESNDPEERVEVRHAKQKVAFRKYLATGQVESRDLLVAGVGSAGTVLIPQAYDSAIFEAQKSYGDLINIVTVMRTDNGNPMKIMLDKDTQNTLTSVTVGTDAAEVDPTLTSALLQVDTFTAGVVKVDNGLLTDAGFDIEQWIRERFGLRYFRGASALIYNGDGGNVEGIGAAFTEGFTSKTAAKITYPDFATAIGTLDPAYQQNAVWAMNQATIGQVIGLSDANGRPLFLPGFGSADQGFVGTILGKPVRLVVNMPNQATGAVPLLYGDFKQGYTFRVQNPGLGIIRLNERYAAAFQTGFAGFARVGGVATIPDSTNPPVIGVTCS